MHRLRQQETINPWLGIKVKFLAIILISFALFASDHLLTNRILDTQRQDALLINLAGRQRMLAARLMLTANRLQLDGEGVADAAGLRDRLRGGIDLFSSTLDAFAAGGETIDTLGGKVRVDPLVTEAGRRALSVVAEKWRDFRRILVDVLNGTAGTGAAAASAVQRRLEEIDIITSVDKVVTILQKEAEKKTALVRRMQTLFIIVGFVLLNLVVLFLHRFVVRPVNALVSTARRIGEGEMELRAPMGGRDEVGFLSRAFNAMMDRLEETTVSRDHLDSIINSVGESIIVTDAARLIRSVNPSTCRMLGCTGGELVGKSIDEIVTARERGKGGGRWLRGEELFDRLTGKGVVVDYDVCYVTAGGEKIPVTFNATRLRDKPGRFSGLVCAAADMREYRKLQARLVQSSKLAALGTLSSGIAHELKTPLAVIAGKASLISHILAEGGERDRRRLKDDMDAIARCADRMTTIIDHLREFSREPETFRPMAEDAAAVVDHSLMLLEKQLESRNIKVEKRIEPGLPPLLCDRNKIAAAFQILADNAADAFELVDDARERRIRISAEAEGGDTVRLRFSDNASGMDPAILGDIFTPFFTTKETGKGTGLGLSTLYGIIEEHGGTVTVQSSPGEGTTFTMRLPAAR